MPSFHRGANQRIQSKTILYISILSDPQFDAAHKGRYVPMVTCFSHSIRFVLFLHTIYYFVGFYYSQLNWSTLINNICAGGIVSKV